ncbi:site-specific integrase [bacterium]|nr:site-specific integrase [bacterium]
MEGLEGRAEERASLTVLEAIEIYKPMAAPLRHHGWRTWCKQIAERWGSRQLKSLTAGDINTLIAEMRKDGKAESTIYACLSTLKRLYAAARSAGVKVYLPEETARTRVDNSRVLTLSAADAERLRQRLLPEDWDICELARETGIRGAELWSLERCDVDLEVGFITVRKTKNGKVRRTPITRRCREVLERMLSSTAGSPYLINPTCSEACKSRQTSMNTWKASVLRPALRALGMKGFSFHGFRHDCATRMARAGNSLYAIQRWLGHQNPQVTTRYSHLVDGDLKKIAETGF